MENQTFQKTAKLLETHIPHNEFHEGNVTLLKGNQM